jgi:hypothetical protein
MSSNPLHKHIKPPNARQAKLKTSIAALESKISKTEADLSAKVHEITQLSSFPSQLHEEAGRDLEKIALGHAQSVVNKYISRLKQYNEIKDIAMGMLSLIAEKRGERLADIMDDRGISEKD